MNKPTIGFIGLKNEKDFRTLVHSKIINDLKTFSNPIFDRNLSRNLEDLNDSVESNLFFSREEVIDKANWIFMAKQPEVSELLDFNGSSIFCPLFDVLDREYLNELKRNNISLYDLAKDDKTGLDIRKVYSKVEAESVATSFQLNMLKRGVSLIKSKGKKKLDVLLFGDKVSNQYFINAFRHNNVNFTVFENIEEDMDCFEDMDCVNIVYMNKKQIKESLLNSDLVYIPKSYTKEAYFNDSDILISQGFTEGMRRNAIVVDQTKNQIGSTFASRYEKKCLTHNGIHFTISDISDKLYIDFNQEISLPVLKVIDNVMQFGVKYLNSLVVSVNGHIPQQQYFDTLSNQLTNIEKDSVNHSMLKDRSNPILDSIDEANVKENNEMEKQRDYTPEYTQRVLERKTDINKQSTFGMEDFDDEDFIEIKENTVEENKNKRRPS